MALTEVAIEARSVRIIPLSNDAGSFITGMRLELHGCALSGDVTLAGDDQFNSILCTMYLFK